MLTRLTACFCASLTDSVGGAPADCCLVSAAPVVAECCAGFAWVRVVSIAPVNQTPSRCIPPTMVMTVELGIDRCAPALCGGLSNPCCASEAEAANVMLGDFAAMQLALGCCMPVKDYSGPAMDQIVLGPWQVGPPEGGGCLRNIMTATITYANQCACP